MEFNLEKHSRSLKQTQLLGDKYPDLHLRVVCAGARKHAIWLMMLGSRLKQGALRHVWLAEVIPRVVTHSPEGYEAIPSFLARVKRLGLPLRE